MLTITSLYICISYIYTYSYKFYYLSSLHSYLMSIFSVTCSMSLAYLLSMFLLYFCFYTLHSPYSFYNLLLFRSLVYGTELILIRIAILHLLGSYSYSRLILIPISRRTHTYSNSSYAVLSLYIYLYGGTYPHTHTYIKLIPIRRYLYTYWYLYLSCTCSDLP